MRKGKNMKNDIYKRGMAEMAKKFQTELEKEENHDITLSIDGTDYKLPLVKNGILERDKNCDLYYDGENVEVNKIAKTVNILGTEYTIKIKSYKEESYFKDFNCYGCCDGIMREIWVCDMKTYPSMENETQERCRNFEKEILRHELVHAFLNESGLKRSGIECEGAWCKNEEMVDWIAIQFPKMLKAFQEVGCL